MNRPLRLAECSQPISWVNATLLTNRQQHYRKPLAAVGADSSCPRIWIHPRNGRRKCMCGDLNTHIWLCKYVYLVMQGYGRDESAPTPGGMFATNFVGERNIINNPLAALRQTVSSRRGRFIVPTYTYSQRIRNPLGHIWQSVSSIIADRQQP